MGNIVDFEEFKRDSKKKDDIRKLLSTPMQSLYLSLVKQSLAESMHEVLYSLGEWVDLGLNQETTAEIMDIFAEEFIDASLAFEFIADRLRKEDE